jgi:hypothetical protein
MPGAASAIRSSPACWISLTEMAWLASVNLVPSRASDSRLPPTAGAS